MPNTDIFVCEFCSVVTTLKYNNLSLCEECLRLYKGKLEHLTNAEAKKEIRTKLIHKHKEALNMPDWSEKDLNELGPDMRADVKNAIRNRDYQRARLGERNYRPKPNEIPCEYCKNYFKPTRDWHHYCSTGCRTQSWNRDLIIEQYSHQEKLKEKVTCLGCGKEFHQYTKRLKFCSNACKQSTYRERKKKS